MLNRFGLMALCLGAILILAGAYAGTASAAPLNDGSACQQADERSFNKPEFNYLSNPLRGEPHAQARIRMAQWGVNTDDPFPRAINYVPAGPQSVVCVIDYQKDGAFGVIWHVRVEVRITGDGTTISRWWSTGLDCFGISQGNLVAANNCGPYGAVDYATAFPE